MLNVRYDPDEEAFIAEYELFNTDTETRKVTIGFQLPVTYRNCEGGRYTYDFTYGGPYGQPFARDFITIGPKQSVSGVIVTDGTRGYGTRYYMEVCQSYELGTPVFKLLEAK